MFPEPLLLAYLEESLPSDKMSEIESALRADASLRSKLSELISRRESGVHTVGDIWRRHRLSCPSREELGSYLLGAMMDGPSDYIRFHIENVGCRYCQSNLDDLAADQLQSTVATRRKRYFQSSVGRVRKLDD